MAERRRALWILVITATLVLGALGGPSWAQLLDDTTSTTTSSTSSTSSTTSSSTTASTSTSTTGPGSTSTTRPDPSDLLGSTTTTTAPGDGDTGGDAGGGESDDGSVPPPEGSGSGVDAPDGDGPTTTPRTIPPEAQAIINAVPRTPANSSKALYEGVQDLVDLGVAPQEAIRVGFGRFPVAGVAKYSHDWLFPRYGPGFRFHLGTDVFAAYGTPLRSPVDGTVEAGTGSLGGLYVKVFTDDGTYFYMAHLSGLPDGFVDGMAVRTGDIVGYVGDSGNAKGGSPHLHLGVYPQGGPATDPKPILDQMLADAMAALPAIVEQVRASPPVVTSGVPADAPRTPRSLLATALLRPLLDERAAGGLSTAVLLETVQNPSSGGLAVAENEAEALAADIDWDDRAAREAARRRFVERTEQLFRLALGPLATN